MSSRYTNHVRCHSSQGSQVVPRSHMEAPWSTGRSDQQPGDTVCIQLHLILKPTSGDLSGSFHSLPPTDGWPNREGEPGSPTVPPTLCKSTAGRLVRMVSHSQVHLQ